jgi:hypothetical protein
VKKTNDQQEAQWLTAEQAREQLRKAIMQEELEHAFRLEVVDRLMTDLKIDPASFGELWIQPLIAAGVSLDVALLCIAQSHHWPN